MKQMNFKRLFAFFVIFITLFSFSLSSDFNVKEELRKEQRTSSSDYTKGLDLDNLIKSLDLILNPSPDQNLDWGKDPFRPAIKITKEEEKSESEEIKPKLKGVVIQKNDRYAIIDDKIVREGEEISGMKVTKIERAKVILKSERKTQILLLD
jgi:hypothetical protein